MEHNMEGLKAVLKAEADNKWAILEFHRKDGKTPKSQIKAEEVEFTAVSDIISLIEDEAYFHKIAKIYDLE